MKRPPLTTEYYYRDGMRSRHRGEPRKIPYWLSKGAEYQRDMWLRGWDHRDRQIRKKRDR